jgi:hypothetical protein
VTVSLAALPAAEILAEELVNRAVISYGDWTVVVATDGVVFSVDTQEGTEEGIFLLDRAMVEDETGRPSQEETAVWAAEAILDYFSNAQAAADTWAEERSGRRSGSLATALPYGY